MLEVLFLSATRHCCRVGCSAVWLITILRDGFVIMFWQKIVVTVF